MMADVIDLDTLKSGDARTGGYFAIIGFMGKLALSVGGVALIALSWVGYDTGKGAVHDATCAAMARDSVRNRPNDRVHVRPVSLLDLAADPVKHQKLQRLLETRQNRLKRDCAVSV